MATYAIGDLQGCFGALQRLLERIQYNPGRDQLWFAGDLVNRGPESLECLRFVRELGDRAITVLGNHDLHLLAVHHADARLKRSDTLQAILDAPDADALLGWLMQQPLVHFDKNSNWCMSHAGLPPQWSAPQALALAEEVSTAMNADPVTFFQQMYGNQPDVWQDDLQGADRLRVIVNYLTRMRFIDASAHLNLTAKEGLETAPEGFRPWFEYPRASDGTRLLFGHWAALEGHTHVPDIWALDTGCVWGGSLTALRLEDQTRFSVAASA